jgi:hypothetical protein
MFKAIIGVLVVTVIVILALAGLARATLGE